METRREILAVLALCTEKQQERFLLHDQNGFILTGKASIILFTTRFDGCDYTLDETYPNTGS